ncbi:glycerol kinase GlpK [Chitinimonas koreensis]|uniref:glycerol kinase GlpK n=1 Tax=Chitinimonas koreensis TaxID=356302 RepID=UPI0004119D15|nr:glycerol kinase GlpK [Chitinimonas koreensis]QNM98084.1 glycerol kinase GlpK [Chitinimonas koreensis]
MSYVLALDQGTTSSRAIVFDRAGRPVASAQQEFPQHFPQPGWVEHDPLDLWRSQLATAREALKRAGIGADQLAGLGITNQRETTVLWERASGRPVANAIVWQDRRTAELCKRLADAGHEALVRERTGLVLDSYFSGPKLAWLLEQVPGARKRAEAGELMFGTVDTWLIWNLTGGRLHITDPSNAARTLLYDIHRQRWDDELLALFGIPSRLLPAVVPSSGRHGETEAELLGAEVTIAGIAGDQQSALFGQACHQPGMAKNTYGTGCFMLLQTGERAMRSEHGLLTTVAASAGGKPRYALEGSVFVGGAVVQWLRDGLGLVPNSSAVEPLAASVPDNGGVYFVPAFTGLGAPHWDPHACGGLLGLSRGTTQAHIARAALEGIAFQSADLLEAMQADSGRPLTELRADGGAAANNLLLQVQADLLGVPVVRPQVLETTALGAALLAGLATGVYASVAELEAQWQIDRVFEPAISRDEAAARRRKWRSAVVRVQHWQV